MATSPISIIRSVKVLESKETMQLVSTTFIAKFSSGNEKFLNEKNWMPLGLLKSSDLIDQHLSPNECCLYFKDWSENPVLGTMKDNYPPSTLPNEITYLLTGISKIEYGDYVQMNDRFESVHIWSKDVELKNRGRWTPLKITKEIYDREKGDSK